MLAPVSVIAWPAKKRGPKTGGTKTAHSAMVWYKICSMKEGTANYKKMSARNFLRTAPHETAIVRGNESECKSFHRYLAKYRGGTLLPTAKKRYRKSPYHAVAKKLVQYVEIRSRRFEYDKCGLNWVLLEAKLLQWAALEDQAIYGNFKASPGFISRVFQDEGMIGINLHGEGNDMTDEARKKIMDPWLDEFWKKLDDLNIKREHLYNADQTGLFYNKMPNRMYLNSNRRKLVKGVKQMKSKDRVTLMVCTSADGQKQPLAVIGKAMKPHCFALCDNKPPLPYKSQKNAWFDKNITRWWISNVFWPYHINKHGNVPCVLLLDNFSGHKDLGLGMLPNNLHIVFFPPNVTNSHQPANMGLIAALKVGYKSKMLEVLLGIFDEVGGFEEATRVRRQQRRGCKGIDCGGKAHVLDAMQILHGIWSEDGKYATNDSIQRCWRKAAILPVSWDIEINQDVGSVSMTAKDKMISKADCDYLCALMGKLSTNVRESNIDTGTLAYGLSDSILETEEEFPTGGELFEIMVEWIDAEDHEEVVEDDVEEALEELERVAEPEDKHDEDDDNDEDEETPVSYFQVMSSMNDARRFGRSIGFTEADNLLIDKLKRRLAQAHQQMKVTNQALQPVLTDFFSRAKNNEVDSSAQNNIWI